MTIFSSDNVTIACPEIMDALIKSNSGNVDSYGHDKWSESLKKKMSDLFETNVEVFIAVTGTAANSLALSALTPGFAGAEIANICNEAAIIAARSDKNEIEITLPEETEESEEESEESEEEK